MWSQVDIYSYKIFDISPWNFDRFFCATFSSNFTRKCRVAHWINFPCHVSFSVCKFSSFIFLECHFGAVVCNCSNSLFFNSSLRYFSDPSGYREWNGIMMGMPAWEPFTSLDTTLIFTWLTQMYIVLICYIGQR